MFFTLNNQKALKHLERLSLRRAFYLPVPKYYGSMTKFSEVAGNKPPSVYVHVNRKAGLISERIIGLVTTILQQHPDVRFLVRFCKYAYGDDSLAQKIDRAFIGSNLEILPAEQNHLEYLSEIERSDMVLLPYDPVEYRGIVSGIFCEAAAMGKILIIPAGTWMADHVTEGRAAGVLFKRNSLDDMAQAMEQAIRNRDSLQALAFLCAPSFREENSCAKNLDGMLELAGRSHDMRLAYVPLTDTTRAFGSQHYFGGGWSSADEGFGTWSDGERAEINFLKMPGPPPLFFNALVRPFLAKGHSRLEVSLAANGVSLAEWSFDASRRGDRDWAWQHVKIPESIAASGEIQIVLNIRSPASPRELGLSIDSRKLGIAIRRFSLSPDAHVPGDDPLEKPSVLVRLRGRIRRMLNQALSPSE